VIVGRCPSLVEFYVVLILQPVPCTVCTGSLGWHVRQTVRKLPVNNVSA